jgi:polysaccharide pyruvyl transferase WcaK-like protein
VLSVILLKGKLVMFPQTYGPFRSRCAALLARFILRRSSVILARDTDSLRVAQQLCGDSTRVRLCPDVAFSLEPVPPKTMKTDSPLPAQRPEVLIGLNVNGLMYRGGYTQKNMFGLKLEYPRFLLRLAETVLSDPSRHLLLVPHTFAPPDRIESDPGACAWLKQQLAPELQKRVHLLEGEYDQGEIKSVIGQCDFFVGSRMHACIAALSQGIPAIGVAYSKKFVGVFETVGMSDCVVDGRDCDAEDAVRRIMEIFKRREAVREVLRHKVNDAKTRLRVTFKEILTGRIEATVNSRQSQAAAVTT